MGLQTHYCHILHILFNKMRIYNPNEISQINFSNGIYIMFEDGEYYNNRGIRRVVRVGTHTKKDRLIKRLNDHFIHKNEDGSIFRKNMGKAILNKDNDSYLPIWIKNTRPKEYLIKKKSTEDAVSDYLYKHITLTAFPVDSRADRLRYETAIIATLNKENAFRPSNNWFGRYSTELKIRNSGLWLKNGLNGDVLTPSEFNSLCNILRNQI